MWRRGKRKECANDADSDGGTPVQKTAKKDTSNDSEDIYACEISKNRRVRVRSWQGKTMVDIREFYDKDGKKIPGKKGISLSMDQWNILRDHVDEIDKAVAENP